MIRVVGVVVALLCLLSAVPAAAVNTVPPGWKELAGSGSGDGLSDNANINDSQIGGDRSVSTAVMPDGRPVVAYRQSNPQNQVEIVVRMLSANSSTWEQLGGPLNVPSSAPVFDPQIKISADGDIFVAWRQQVDLIAAIYLLTWDGADWIPLAGSDLDGRVTTEEMVPNTIPAFSLALTPDKRPILAFESQAAIPFDPNSEAVQIVFSQVYVMRWNGTSWPFLGGGPFDGGGASNAATFKFPLDAPTTFAFHRAVGPRVVSDAAGNPIVTFFYTTSFDGPAPAEFQGNRDDLYAQIFDGLGYAPLGPAVPTPGSPESLGAPGGISASPAVATSPQLVPAAPPSVAIDPITGLPVVTWAEGSGATDVFGVPLTFIRVSEFDGTQWTELGAGTISDTTSGNRFPSIDFYDEGVPVVVWSRIVADSGVPSILAKQYDAGTGQFVEIGTGSATVAGGIGGTDSQGFAPSSAIGPGPDRLPFVAWLEQGITFPPQVFLRYFDAAGAAPSPAITSFAPTSGPVGTMLTITGTNLGPDSVSRILFNGVTEAQPVTASATMMTVVVPEGAHSGPISVQGPGGLATSTGSFKVTPKITSFSPMAAGFGQTVTIVGFNLRVGLADPIVKFGGVAAALTGGALGDTTVKAIVPATAPTGPITVTTSDGTGTSPTNFIFLQPPQITAITPASGPAGTLVHVTGRGLRGLEKIGFIAFDDGARFNSSTFTETPAGIDIVIPVGATTGRITVFNPLGSFNSSVFTVTPGNLDLFPRDVVAGSDAEVTVSGTNLFASPTAPLPGVKVGAVSIPPASITGPFTVVGPAAAPPVTARSGLRFRVPAGTPSGKVTITTTAGSGTSSATLNVIQPPKIVSFTPASGAVGTLLTITGTGLNGSTVVTFGGNVSAPATQVMPTSLKVTVPDGALTGVLRVTNPAATGPSTGVFKVTPRITGFAPPSVVAGSGTPVTITGSNLQALTGSNTVKVGAFTIPFAAVLANSSTSIQFTVPPGAVTGKIGVTTADGAGVSATNLVVIQPPKATTFTPVSGPVGTPVTISGMNFSGNVSVTFGGNVTVAAQLLSATSVKATVPDGALTGKLSVTNEAGTGQTTTAFKVSPRITGFTPASVVAGGGVPVRITGSNLQALTGVNTVKVGAFTIPFAAVLANSSTSIEFVVPLGAFTGKLSVTTLDGVGTSATGLVVIQPPKPTTFTPVSGSVGTPVTISGMNFSGNVSVTFGGNVTVTATLLSATMVRATVPDGALTGKLAVTNEAGTGTTAAAFKVSPKISGFSPASVVAGSGTPVTITGSNLQALTGVNAVKVGAFTIPSAAVLANSSASIQFLVPLAAFTGRLSVTTVDGVGVSAADLLVIQPPRITALAPAAGPVGALVTISGVNFTGVTTVTFGGNVSTAPSTVSATMVKVAVPDGALTGPISVTNAAGTSTSVASFKVSPKITGFSPASVPVGGEGVVTVTGVNLRAATGSPVVKVGAFTIPAAFVLGNSSATAVQFMVPAPAVTGRISVTTLDGTGTSASDLIVIQPPRPTGFTPTAAPAGAQITINGSNFTGVDGVTFPAMLPFSSGGSVSLPVTFEASADIVSVTPTAVKVIVPFVAINGQVRVSTAAGFALTPQSFKVLPSITSVDPATGSAGESITVMGANLQSMGADGFFATPVVKVNGVPAEVTAATPFQLTLTIPGLARTGPITVTTADGMATSPTNLVVTTPVVPDLVVSSVIVPAGGAVRSTPDRPQTVSITTTVTNQGLAAAGPFNVAILLVPNDGSGPRVLGLRRVPAGLASGAASTAATVIPLPTDAAPGPWEVRAIVDYDEIVAELVEDNNTRSAGTDAPLQIFESLGGSRRFTVTLQPASCLPLPFPVTIAGTGTITQTLGRFNVSGLTLTGSGLTISVSRLTGVLSPDGSVNEGSVTFSIQGVSHTLDLNGFVADGVVDGFLFASDGHCPDLSVTVNATPLPRLALSFDFFATVGTFDADGVTALPSFPASISTWSPLFVAAYDGGFQALTFVGPAGSNFVRPPERIELQMNRTVYRGRPVLPADGPAEPPSGTWQVAYKGAERPFVVAPPQSAARVIVPVPVFTADENGVRRIDWTYRNAAGTPLATTPTFLRSIGVTVTDAAGSLIGNTGGQLPDTRHVVLENPFTLECAATVTFDYEDTLGNRYRVAYGRNVAVDTCGFAGSASASTSILTTEMRSGTTRRRTLTVQYEAPQGLVQSASVTGGPFAATPLPFTGTRRLFDAISDRFVVASDLADGTPFPPAETTFSVDALFRGSTVPVMTSEAFLDAPPSDGTLPFTGPSTTGQFDIATVRGVPTTFQWSLDQLGFEGSGLFLSGRGTNAIGEACAAADQPGSLDFGITEATLTIPATCFGRPTVFASVCILARGSGAGSDTSTCHIYDTPPTGGGGGGVVISAGGGAGELNFPSMPLPRKVR